MVTIGLYRLYSGGYYYVNTISKELRTGNNVATFFNVLHPEYGMYSEAESEFRSTSVFEGRPVKDEADNVTGQVHKFEKVKSLEEMEKNITTEKLVNELNNRVDSPIRGLDIEGMNDKVFSVDYVVGEEVQEDLDNDIPKGVSSILSFTTEGDAKKYLSSHKVNKRTRLFKRTFIKVD